MRFPGTVLCCYAQRIGLLSFVLGVASLCSGATITYDVNQTIGAGSVTGDIVTDGTIGSLTPATNFVDWNLLMDDGTSTVDLLGPLSGSNSVLVDFTGAGNVSATATQLSFNFSGAPGTNPFDVNEFYFATTSSFNPFEQSSLCFQSTPSTFGCGPPSSGETLEVNGDSPLSTSLSGTQVIGTAVATPEPSYVALQGAGILALLAFRKLVNRSEGAKSR
jgi:hypothetical protein